MICFFLSLICFFLSLICFFLSLSFVSFSLSFASFNVPNLHLLCNFGNAKEEEQVDQLVKIPPKISKINGELLRWEKVQG
jgi:hypothetical protein